MKKYIVIILVGVALVSACKSKKAATATTAATSTATAVSASTALGLTVGKVSHQYRAGGCATVIVFSKEGSEMTLIPKDKLPTTLDVDGLEINFNYHLLKMPNPAGCTVGMPAEITDISKK